MRSHAFHLQASEENWRTPTSASSTTAVVPCLLCPLRCAAAWHDWIAETERATGAPADYVLQSVLAGVAAVCGAGVRVRVTPAWDEPLVLWQAVVGEPSTGKSAALAPMRRLLDLVEQERRAGDEERRAAHAERGRQGRRSRALRALAGRGDAMPIPLALADIVSGNPRGVLLWRDGRRRGQRASAAADDDEDDSHRATWLAAWEAGAVTVARPRQPARSLPRFPVSILETIRPERLKEALQLGRRQPGRALPVRLAGCRSPIARSRSSSARATRRSCSGCARCHGWRGAPTIPACSPSMIAGARRSTRSWRRCMPSGRTSRGWRRRGSARAGR